MSAERATVGDVRRLIVIDEDGDRLTVDAHPGGGLVIAAERDVAESERECIPVHVAPTDRAALVAFLTGDARTEQSAEQSAEACARCGGPRDAHPGGACDEWVDEAGEDLT